MYEDYLILKWMVGAVGYSSVTINSHEYIEKQGFKFSPSYDFKMISNPKDKWKRLGDAEVKYNVERVLEEQ